MDTERSCHQVTPLACLLCGTRELLNENSRQTNSMKKLRKQRGGHIERIIVSVTLIMKNSSLAMGMPSYGARYIIERSARQWRQLKHGGQSSRKIFLHCKYEKH